MIGVCLVMSIFAATGARLTRGEGAVMLAGYGAYIFVIMP
jgi:cation:H+ antiporter